MKNGKGLRCYKNSRKDVKYSIGNVLNNIVITVYGVGWVLDLLG